MNAAPLARGAAILLALLLALSQAIERAKEHSGLEILVGGELEIDSRPGGGTAVSLRVP